MSGRSTTLRAAAEVALGRQRAPQHDSGPHMVPYLRAANVKDGVLDLTDVKEMNFTPAEQQTFSLRPGDVLITEGSGSISSVGASAVWRGEIDGVVCFQNTLLRLRPRDDRADGGFLEWWARSAFGSGVFASVATGANIYHISAERVRALPIELPPLEEQRRIVDFLDAETARIDRLDRSDQKLLGLLGERRKAVIDHEVDASCRSFTKLFWKLSVLRDGTHQPPPRVDLGVPLLTARNVSSGGLRLTELDTHVSEDDADLLEKSLRMMAGDVLLSVKGTIGACAVVPAGFPRSVLDRNVALLRPLPEYSSEWLAFVLRSTGLQDQMRISVTAAAQPGLPLGVIRNLRVPDVPLNEQEGRVDRISARCREIDQVVDRVKRKGSLLTERRQALITAAVTGQFDVTTASGRNVTDGVTA